MSGWSAPRAEITEYTIYPTGYDQSPFSDPYNYVIKVKRFQDTGKWYVDLHGHWQLSHKGKWIDRYDRKNTTQWCRYDTAEIAIEIALKYVDSQPGHRNMVDAIKRFDPKLYKEMEEANA